VKKKIKKPKKKTVSQLKKELDKLFSIYIRKKYEKNGYIRCYTCGASKAFGEIQNGHFVSRSYLATRYSELNCRPQCVGCNVFGGGQVAIFAVNLDRENGEGTAISLYKEAHKIVKDFPYVERIEYYKKEIEKIDGQGI